MGYPAPALTSCIQPHPPGQATDLPSDWIFRETGYFYSLYSSQFFGDPLGEEERKESLDRAGAAQFRLFSAWPLILFGVAEQLIFLLLTIAQGLTFVSFSVAILFAFFKKTEVIARSILDMWIELIIQTIAIALIQSLIVSFLLGAAATQNALVVLGVSLICAIFILVLLWSGVKAVWNSFNRLFGAIGQATGGVMVAPGVVGLGLAGAGVAAGRLGGAGGQRGQQRPGRAVRDPAGGDSRADGRGDTGRLTAVEFGSAHAGLSARHTPHRLGPHGRRIYRRGGAAPGRAESAAGGWHRRAAHRGAAAQRPERNTQT
jgi:hypothetical protein